MEYINNLRKTNNTNVILITHRLNLNVYADDIIYIGK